MKTIASCMFTIERRNPWNQAQTHTVQEFGAPEHRDTASSNANKINFATDEENIDFNISGVPNAMVKRSHGINVHNLIQKIENHPQRQALQSDLQQHRAFNPFSKESKDAIRAAGNTELCEDGRRGAESTMQSMPDVLGTLASSTARVDTSCEMIQQKTRSISRPCWISSLSRTSTSGKCGPHGHRYGKKEGCKEFRTAKQLQKRVSKETIRKHS